MKRIILIMLLAVSGCAQTNYQWSKQGATVESFEKDKGECIYQAAAATSGYGTAQTARGMSGAIGQGFGEGIAEIVRRRELEQLCMQAKGYTRHRVP